jgi:thioredoxin-like negative regulator of GroEL
MTMQIAPDRRFEGGHHPLPEGVPLVVEFTSSRARQRPLAARAGGIDLPGMGRLPVRAVDVDAYPDLRRRFRIQLVPTFIVILDAAEVARLVGPHTRRELTGSLRRALNPATVRIAETPSARGLWNDFTTRLWAFTSG